MFPQIGNTELNLSRATSSFLENTLPIFLPVSNIGNTKAHKEFMKNNGSLIVKSPFGIIEIRGRLLGQNHKDILEMLLCQTKSLVQSDNSISVNFGRYKFLKNIKKNVTSYDWLEDKIKEIRDFNFGIEYIDKNGKIVQHGGFGIIDQYKFLDNKTMSIKFTKEFTEFYKMENLLDYGSYVSKIAALEEPFLKALVREMIKHQKYQINFNTFIENYNLNNLLSGRAIYKFKELLLKDDVKDTLLKQFNIIVKNVGEEILIAIKRDNSKVCVLINNKSSFPVKQK